MSEEAQLKREGTMVTTAQVKNLSNIAKYVFI